MKVFLILCYISFASGLCYTNKPETLSCYNSYYIDQGYANIRTLYLYVSMLSLTDCNLYLPRLEFIHVFGRYRDYVCKELFGPYLVFDCNVETFSIAKTGTIQNNQSVYD